MPYGPIPPKKLPKQDSQKILLLAERWQRAAAAQEKWATPAKACVDFLEGRQWTEAQVKKLEAEGRPALVFNKIGPLVRLVLGYFQNNRTDDKYLPGHEGLGTAEVAEALTKIGKQISEINQQPYVDTEIFLDGITTGRGYCDTRMNFENNDFGEAAIRAVDPFSVFLDPDGQDYDLNSCSYLIISRFISVDEVEAEFGKTVAQLIGPLIKSGGNTGMPTSDGTLGEISPETKFGREEELQVDWWNQTLSMLGDFVDPLRRTIRIFDFQYWQTERKRIFIDLETGDRSVVPDHWDKAKIQKVLWYAEQKDNPLVMDIRPVKQVRWTTMIGDLMVHDRWSPYDTYSLTGYFPYFRRGMTRGMVEDLLDPQREINKRRSAEIEIVCRTSNTGWLWHEKSLDPIQEANLQKFGSMPGFNLKWKGEQRNKPERINPAPPPMAMERLEKKGEEDLRIISGINESALGELDRVQSGRALEARQRQAVIGLQMYMTNFSRTKELLGRKKLNLIQKHYTEERVFRIIGEDGKEGEVVINRAMEDPTTGVISKLNDVTLGKYSVVVDETPLSASFLSAQFEEALLLIEKLQGALPLPAIADVLIDLSSLPRKEEIKQKIQQFLLGTTSLTPPPGGGPAPGGPVGNAPSLDQAAVPGGNVVPLPSTGERPRR